MYMVVVRRILMFKLPTDEELASRMEEKYLVMTYEAQKTKKRQTKYAKAIKAEMIRRNLL